MENINTPKEQRIAIKNNHAILFVQILIVFGVLSIMVFAIRMMWSYDALTDKDGLAVLNQFGNKIFKESVSFHSSNLNIVISFFSLGILIGGSALAIGCLIRFIFAIPRLVTNTSANFIQTKNGYVANDNLVQVSDWLAKIIVGVGLTQLTNIPGYLQSMGQYIAPSLGGSIAGEVAAESIVVYFLICGFLLSCLWTRLYFAKMLGESENE